MNLRSNYRTSRSGRFHSRNQEYESVYGRPATAALVFFPGAARARIVPTDLGSATKLTRVDTRVDRSMRPEIPISCHEPSRHVQDDFFVLLWAHRLGAHLRVFIVLVAEHHHRDQASAVLLVVDKLGPTIVAHAHAPHEAASPVVAVRHAVLV